MDVLLNLLIIGLSNGAVLALNAIGVTLVYGVVRTLNFAHGDLFALTTVLVTTLITDLLLAPWMSQAGLAGGLVAALAVAVVFGVLLNVGVERLAFRPFRGRSRLAPLIATLGLSFILYQAALVWRKLLPNWIPGEHRSLPGIPEVPRGSIPDLVPPVDLLRLAGLGGDVSLRLKDALILLLACAAALLVHLFLRHSKTGKTLRAVAEDAQLAQLCGVHLDRAVSRVFALGGALAGAAAFGFVLYTTHPFGQHGAQSGLLAFTAAILGGIGSPVGALLAGLVLGVLAALSDYFLAAQWTPVLTESILILLLLVRPTGLTAQEGAEDLAQAPLRDSLANPRNGLPRGWTRWATWGLLALALVYPALDSGLGLYKQSIVSGIAVLAVLALGLNLLLGYAGLLDLGYAASFGVGAYTAALLVNPWGQLAGRVPQPMDFLVVLGVSGAAAGLFGAVNGWLTLRLRSDYLAIVTLAFGHVVYQTVVNLNAWTGGIGGLSALPAPQVLTLPLSTSVARYYLALALVLLTLLLSRRLLHSRLGRAWQAIADDEVAAASSGVDVLRVRVLAFILATAVAGMAGALYVGVFSHISPDQIDFSMSAMLLAMVVVGGAGSVPGVLLGVLAIAGYDRLLLPWLGGVLAPYRVGQGGLAALLDLRELNFLAFGLVLYLTVWLRARRLGSPTERPPARLAWLRPRPEQAKPG